MLLYIKLIVKKKHYKDHLICVGDYIDRGLFSGKIIQLLTKYLNSGNCSLLLGNHDFYYAKYISGIKTSQEKYLIHDFENTKKSLLDSNITDSEFLCFFDKLLLIYERNSFFVSHAGINLNVFNIINSNLYLKNVPFSTNSVVLEQICGHKRPFLYENILLDRSFPNNLGKMQIHGHTPLMCFNPVYYSTINCWNLDTGAFLGWGMSAILVNDDGEVLDTFFERTDHRDINFT